jgi:hypothetical protein
VKTRFPRSMLYVLAMCAGLALMCNLPSLPGSADNALITDDFSGDGGYLGTYDEADGSASYVTGGYVIDIGKEFSYIYGSTLNQELGPEPQITPAAPLPKAVSVEADLANVNAPPDAQFGLACKWRDYRNFYALLIRSDGRGYGIYRVTTEVAGQEVDTPFFVLLAGQDFGSPHSAILTTVGAVNHLRAECSDERLAFFVNEQKLAETAPDDERLTADTTGAFGGVGVVGSTKRTPHAHAAFDNFVVRALPSGVQLAETTTSGQVMFQDDFADNAAEWDIGSYAPADFGPNDGAFKATLEPDSFYAFSLPMGATTDTRIEGDVTFVESGDGALYGGFACRVSDTWGSYEAVIDNLGDFAIGKYSAPEDKFENLVGWTGSKSIPPGLNQTSHVRLDCVGDTITLYVNGEKMSEVHDSSFPLGALQLEAASPGDNSGALIFDNVVATQP